MSGHSSQIGSNDTGYDGGLTISISGGSGAASNMPVNVTGEWRIGNYETYDYGYSGIWQKGWSCAAYSIGSSSFKIMGWINHSSGDDGSNDQMYFPDSIAFCAYDP